MYNIALAAMGIAISPTLYTTHSEELQLRNKLLLAVRDVLNVGSHLWYANDKDSLHVCYDALDLDTSIHCSSG